MLEITYEKFKDGCMMLFNREGSEVAFLGTSFLVHKAGYLLTASRILPSNKDLMVAPAIHEETFVPLSYDKVTPIPVDLVREDWDRDIALLKFKQELEISAPDHIVGSSREITVGSQVVCLGFPFGYYHLHNQVIYSAILCSKIKTLRGNNLLLFNTMIHDGARGGPLVNVEDGRVVGVVSDRLDPTMLSSTSDEKSELSANTNISFAMSMEYAVNLMQKEELDIF